jgi:hypothetical protein
MTLVQHLWRKLRPHHDQISVFRQGVYLAMCRLIASTIVRMLNISVKLRMKWQLHLYFLGSLRMHQLS